MSRLDPDLLRSASHRHMVRHVPPPLSAGARDIEAGVQLDGRIVVAWPAREPLVLVAPAKALDDAGLRVAARLDPDGAARDLAPLHFDRYTEVGAFLPLHVPVVDLATRTAAPFTIALEVAEVLDGGLQRAVAAADVGSWLTVVVVEGILGRTAYLLGAEKLRIRRVARELRDIRLIATARDDALDRMGAEIGVPRLESRLEFDPATRTILTRGVDAAGLPERESDDAYRRRLGIYRPMLVPSRSNLERLLNGPGDAAAPNAGVLGAAGVVHRFEVVEADNDLAVAIHLVQAGPGTARDDLHRLVSEAYLVWPGDAAANDAVHARRYVPSPSRDRIAALRARLRTQWVFNAGHAVAPALAVALDRVGRCRQALGDASQWVVQRAADPAGGSRFELGLGIEVVPPPAAILDQMAAAVGVNPVLGDDPATQEVRGLLRGIRPRSSGEDPEGRWLLEGCGIRTVHRTNTGSLYLSHLPTFGLVIEGPSTVDPVAAVALEARYHAPGDPGRNAVLAAALKDAGDAWVAAGHPAWTSLTDPDASVRWAQVGPRAAVDPALLVFTGASLPAVQQPGPVVTALERLPKELVETIRLDPAQSQRILAGQPAAIDELAALVALLRARGVAGVLPLVSGGEVLLVVAVIGLPEAGLNLTERRSTAFRWYVVPIEGSGGRVRGAGSRTEFVPNGPGLSAVVALGYARRGLTDPYEFRVDLPDGAVLDLRQYELLMNVLEHACPLGIEVNTFNIRRRHVDIDGDGVADPLPPTLARTFRAFRHRRWRGIDDTAPAGGE